MGYVNVEPSTYRRVYNYCKKNDLVLRRFISRVLKEKMDEIEKKKEVKNNE